MIININGEECDILIENIIQPLRSTSKIRNIKLYINDEKEYIKMIEEQTKETEERFKKEEYKEKHGTILINMIDELIESNKNFIKERKRINKKYIKIIKMLERGK